LESSLTRSVFLQWLVVSDLEEFLFDDDIEQMIVLLAAKELEDQKKNP
jgi:hypothetical protein